MEYVRTNLGVLYCGDALQILKMFPDNSIDAVVTDPPYGLKFMNQKWDYDVPSVELWKEVLRVLKPGGHLLSFFGTRTYHRGVVNIEDAGFEIRDMVQWLYGSGFPKSTDISKAIDKEFGKLKERQIIGYYQRPDGSRPRKNVKAKSIWGKADGNDQPRTAPATPEAAKWQGWGTALKPACEPIVLARKPISEKNIAQNVLKWGTGGLNIDRCRIPVNGEKVVLHSKPAGTFHPSANVKSLKDYRENTEGRFPANVILDEEAAKLLDGQSGVSKSNLRYPTNKVYKGVATNFKNNDVTIRGYQDIGGASRFFYVAKAGKKERYFYCRTCKGVYPQSAVNEHRKHDVVFHPTVKPLKLIKYLVKLVTPPNGIVLDPFFGTGTLGVACEELGIRWIGIELNLEYCEIAKKRVEEAQHQAGLFY